MNDSATFPPIVVEQTYPVPASELWQAITQHEKMLGWFFPEISSFQAEVGFETKFTVHFEGQDFIHAWKILEVEPESKLVYSWSYDGIEGDSVVTWTVSQHEDGSKLHFQHEVTKPFPTDNPVFSPEACQGGWDYFLKGQLPAFFENSAKESTS